MSNKYENVPDHVRLDDVEVLFLALVRHISKWLPPELMLRTQLTSDAIDEGIATRQLSLDGMLAAAYFGFVPFWTTYEKFQASVRQINNYAEHPHWQSLRKDEAARENIYAADYQLARGEVKRLLKRLDEKSRDLGFQSFKDVFEVQDTNDPDTPSSPGSDATLAAGPRYLWDIAKAAKAGGHANFMLKTFNGWVLMLHLEEETVFALALPAAGLRIGGYKFNGFIDEGVMQWSWRTEAPIFSAPEEVLLELRALAQLHFPGRDYEECEPPTAHDAMSTWTIIDSLFKREA